MLALCIQSILVLLVGFFSLYVLLETRSLRQAKKGVQLTPMVAGQAMSDADLPTVSVLLPVYNEKLVVVRLIDAVCALDYPREKLEILLLDDSTDKTREIAAERVAAHQTCGVPIIHARREKRVGYKAGNLTFGLGLAKGDFIAIFDADCLPPVDFLRKAMPCFNDPRVGFLQTGVDYANKDASFLTRFQATEAGHKEDVTSGLSRDGFMASLTGSSCIWRKECIKSIGGIRSDTITEDVDMGYKAQLGAWKYAFLPEVVSLAELPESMGAFRLQRQRWAHGLIHNALRHARQMWAVQMPLFSRLHAVALMFSSLLLASFYALLLLCLPVALVTPELGLFFHGCCSFFLLAAVVWAWGNTSGQGKPAPLWQQITDTLGYVLMFFPVSLYYFTAAIQVFCGINGKFYRTPKGCGRKKMRHPPINVWLLRLEIFSLVYALVTLLLSLVEGNYWVTLYCSLAAGGFGMTLYFSWGDRCRAGNPRPRHICITGASGALGSALALEYAAPGIRLTLHGRRMEVLEDLAEQCRGKGASVGLQVLDLRNHDDVRRWMRELCKTDAPDLLIANAGLNTDIGPEAKGEPFEEVTALVQVNILAVMALVDAVLPAMRQRHSGQIAIISSLAAYYGLPVTPAYCASKAALRSYGLSLRGWLQSEGIRVNVVLPGYVASPMCAAMPGPKPFLWQPQRAARTIRRGLERDWARISFPFPLNLGIWGLSILPACLSIPVARWLGYGR